MCSNASCFALGTDLRGIRSIVFLLAIALLTLLSPPECRGRGSTSPTRAMQLSPTVENFPNNSTVARGERCFDEATRAGRTVACTYAVSLAVPSARCALVLRCPQNSSLRLLCLFQGVRASRISSVSGCKCFVVPLSQSVLDFLCCIES